MAKRATGAKTAVLFGGTGFIGRYVIRGMAKRGWQVNVATRRPDEALFLKTCGSIGQIAPVYANIHDDASVRAAMRGADIVINLVGILYETRRQKFDAVHHLAAERIARIATELEVDRLVQVSAIGASDSSESLYARSKSAGEQAVMKEFPRASVLRPSIVIGPEDGFFNLFAGLARIAPYLPLIGGGHTRFQPVYVGDVADAVMAVLDHSDSVGQTYELGGPKVYSFKELMQLMLSEIGMKRLLLPVPWGLANVKAAILGLMPKPLLTPDQVKLLRVDNIVADDAKGFGDLGIDSTAIEIILPTYLRRFRPGGRFAAKTA